MSQLRCIADGGPVILCCIHGSVQIVGGSSSGLTIGSLSVELPSKCDTFWSLATWLKCGSFLLLTIFTKTVSVRMCSTRIGFDLSSSVFICTST